MASSQEAMISDFCEMTGANSVTARNVLSASDWDLAHAVSMYLTEQEGAEGAASQAPDPQGQAPSNPPASSSSFAQAAAASRSQGQPGLRTLRDLQSGPAGGQDDDDDDEDDDKKDTDFFAGGEKSGLAVQNPNSNRNRNTGGDPISNILRQAERSGHRVQEPDAPDAPNYFKGNANTVGSDDTPSQLIRDPQAGVSQPPPRVRRVLHLWRDGFSVDDGDLYRYDDPANSRLLDMINSGRAPVHILNVLPDQEVDLAVDPHREEDYKKPKGKYNPFGGGSQRLGSPVPGSHPVASTAQTSMQSSSSASKPSTSPQASTVQVDQNSPSIPIQIRLGNGSRLQSRFNTSMTIGDIYDFVNASNSNSTAREYVLATNFPTVEFADRDRVLGDIKELAKGGMLMQKWK